MNKGKKLLVLGLILAYICTAAACRSNDQGNSNSGSLADNHGNRQTESYDSRTGGGSQGDGLLDDVGDALGDAAEDIGAGMNGAMDSITGGTGTDIGMGANAGIGAGTGTGAGY